MWFLTSDNDKRVLYVLQGKNPVTIGRYVDGPNCDFTIAEDASISRKHATLTVSEGDLLLKDLGSKYGTYINNSDKVEHNKMIKLNNGDVVKFGKMSCIWRVSYINFITCTSTLKGENLHNLKKVLDILGGTLKNEWDDTCMYLTMPAITLTIKVVLALVQKSHIVTIDYWKKCVEAISNNLPLPSPNNFIPQILESTLNKENVSFIPKNERCNLFAGKKVIFFSRRQLEMYKTALLKSSATALLLSESKLTKAALCEEDVIVIQYNLSSINQETQSQRDQINEIIDYLKSKGKRVVADAEIGLAILYCSTTKYCNPAFNFPSEVIKQVPQQNTSARDILAPESQETSQNLCRNGNVLIDASLTPNCSSNENKNNPKRKLSEDCDVDGINNISKKLATEKNNIPSSNSNKRQNDCTDLENPAKKVAITNEDDNVFNFKKSVSITNVNQSDSNKKLNLFKPIKRKHDADDDEEDLFNFVDKNNKKGAIDKPVSIKSEPLSTIERPDNDKINVTQNIDIAVIRGSKLEELMKNNAKVLCLKNLKKEDTTEIDEKLSNMDLGSTSVIVRNDLIVKKETIQVQSPESRLKNFKKFKKVWPIKLQVTIVPRLSEFTNASQSSDNKENIMRT